MKYIKITIIILFILIFTTGCTDLIKDPYSKEDRMKFQENITINYGKKDVDTTKKNIYSMYMFNIISYICLICFVYHFHNFIII